MSEMLKTSQEMCAKCKHGSWHNIPERIVVCNYLLDTGRLRNCEIGECDKYEEGRRRKSR